jgi:hypothetical protein
MSCQLNLSELVMDDMVLGRCRDHGLNTTSAFALSLVMIPVESRSPISVVTVAKQSLIAAPLALVRTSVVTRACG